MFEIIFPFILTESILTLFWPEICDNLPLFSLWLICYNHLKCWDYRIKKYSKKLIKTICYHLVHEDLPASQA